MSFQNKLFCNNIYFIGIGTCLQLFAKWRRCAHLKLSQLIWEQQNFHCKQTRQSLNFFSSKLLDGITCVPCSVYRIVSRKKLKYSSALMTSEHEISESFVFPTFEFVFVLFLFFFKTLEKRIEFHSFDNVVFNSTECIKIWASKIKYGTQRAKDCGFCKHTLHGTHLVIS